MPSAKNESVNEQPKSRRAEVVDLPISYATYVDRWAIVVGVSKYKNERLNLQYAHRDAQELYDLLLTPTGGGFEEEKVIKLIDEEATTANITRALRSFLKKPAKEDIVVLYFACHGAPDIDRPDILYLLTHDTDPADISGTALPMREINLSIQENLLAERVVIMADTCHSAGISSTGTRDVGDSSGSINLYLKEAATAKKGVALLTSAEANQVSLEDEKWGGGHGVFTHYLLEGMRGAADNSPKNGIVTVGELFEYVRDKVKDATGSKQHPCVGTGSYDRNLPMAITAGISAQEHYELGCELYQIGLTLDDHHCFEAASRHLRESIRQSAMVKHERPEAYLQLGLALTASGNLPEEGIRAFDNAIKAGVPDADYNLGIAYINHRRDEAAKKHLEAFIDKHPDSDKVSTVKEVISWLSPLAPKGSHVINRHALLIGINYSETKDSQYSALNGCVNDIEILGDVLSQKYGFNVKLLSDMEATYEGITHSFDELQEKTDSTDVVVIYFAGHMPQGSWLAADTKLNSDGKRLNTISIEELCAFIDVLPASYIHLITDAWASGVDTQHFIDCLKKTKLSSFFLSALPGSVPYETKHPDTDKHHGYFTYTLVENLSRATDITLQKTLVEQVREGVKSKFPDQVPFFMGDLKGLLLPTDFFTFSRRRCYIPYETQYLHRLQQKFEAKFNTVFPDFYYSLGLAFSEKKENSQALKCLKTASEDRKLASKENLFRLGMAQLRNQLYSQASQSFQRCVDMCETIEENALIEDVISDVNDLEEPKRYALLVGIDSYLNPDIPEITADENQTRIFSKRQDLHFARAILEEPRFTRVLLFEKKLGPEEIDLPTTDLLNKQEDALSAVRQVLSNCSWAVETKDDELSDDSDYQVAIDKRGTYEICRGMPIELNVDLKIDNPEAAKEVIEQIFSLSGGKVDENGYNEQNRRPNGHLVDDLLDFHDVLIKKCGFKSENIEILVNEEATRAHIIKAFQDLANKSFEHSAVFYFAGRGSVVTSKFHDSDFDKPTILAFDSRTSDLPDIQLTELADFLYKRESNLLSIIDSNWTETSRGETRYIHPSSRKVLVSRSREEDNIPKIGFVSIYPGLIRHKGKAVKNYGNGSLTAELTRFLMQGSQSKSTYTKLFDFFKRTSIEDKQVPISFVKHDLDDLESIIFSNSVIETRVQMNLNKIEQRPVSRITLILQRLIEQRNGSAPEELVSLGIAYYKLAEYDKSIAALQTALDQISGQPSASSTERSLSQVSYPEAHYWLGRVLYESERDPARAVSELRLAVQEAPEKTVGHYYLGQALRTLVEQEILTEAERSFQKYLEGGAPLGQQEEIHNFLRRYEGDAR